MSQFDEDGTSLESLIVLLDRVNFYIEEQRQRSIKFYGDADKFWNRLDQRLIRFLRKKLRLPVAETKAQYDERIEIIAVHMGLLKKSAL